MSLIIIGICGGTSSGKTSFSRKIFEKVGKKGLLISQDSFYKGLDDKELGNVENYNFDHPDSIDFDEMYKVLYKLKRGEISFVPKYNFTTHTREGYLPIDSKKVKILIIEGILIFCNKKIRDLMDFKIFIDTDSDIRLIRRIERDIKERGRTMEMVIKRYKKFLKPSHEKYVEPSKKYANIIIPKGVDNFYSLELLSKIFN